MPLHLLGKKSWNVYNADNIARVRRDEAAAKAAEEAEEQRMQEVDARRRLAILRGEVPEPLPEEEEDQPQRVGEAPGEGRSSIPGADRKKRKRAGEDDTDFELRVAKERQQPVPTGLEVARKPTSSAPIVDHAGHIDLFGDKRARAHAEKNEEAEKESKKKKREFEDQYTMRFSNAAGRDGLSKPWYSQSGMEVAAPPLKDTWGNEDPNRKDRDARRRNANDPLAMMKSGASKVRQVKRERKRFQEEREQELKQLRKEERRREKHSKRRGREARDRSEEGDSNGGRRRSMERRGRGESDGRGDLDKRRHRDERRRDSRSRSPDQRRRHRRDD